MSRTLVLATAQLHPRKGDYPGNMRRLGQVIAELDGATPRPQVVHFPETVLSGYFVEGGVREVAVTAGQLARDLDAAVRAAAPHGTRPIDVVVGFYERWRETLHNSAAYVRIGDGAPRVLHVHRKAFLPTYGLFDEERFVERGHEVRSFDTPWGRAAMLICEDAWHSLSATIAALGDAELIFVSAATPARGAHPRQDETPGPASVSRWERLIREMAEEHGVFVSLSNLVGSEGGKVFAGASCVFGPHGDVRARAPSWEEAVVVTTLGLGDIGRARADTPLLADLRTALPHLRKSLELAEGRATAGRGAEGAEVGEGAAYDEAPVARASAAPSVGAPPPRLQDTTDVSNDRNHFVPVRIIASPAHTPSIPTLEIDAALVERWLVRFLADELSRRGMQRVVVGLSGGVDSAVTATLAARALGPANVLAVRLPYRTSSPDSLAHAQLVIDQLGIPSTTLDISSAVDGYLALAPGVSPARAGNVMARTRMIALFDQSAACGGIPLGTGNKSERLLGYFTWHADDSPPVNPLGDLFKTQVWALARHLGVPDAIVDKPASADLVSGQTDEGDFGISYARADVILNALTSGYAAADLPALGFAPEDVELVRRRLDGTHWKRRLPAVAMLSQSAIGESYLRPVDY
ncbi:MAG: NAD+ synthase [Gemmatimonadetes bacterium]|nr:NAD+ synthase [Gemmatimonadota bacterium]